MAFNIRDFVVNADDPDHKKLYDAIDNLVNIAGDLRIEDLFKKSRREIGERAWKAIQDAKPFGFLAMNNNNCCRGGKCQASATCFCSSTKSGECSAASDACSDSGVTALSLTEMLHQQGRTYERS